MQTAFDANAFVTDYVKAFEAGDACRVSAFYNAPCLSVRADGSLHNFSEQREIESFFRSVLDAYTNEGMATFAAKEVSVDPIGSASCRFSCTWSMQRDNGRLIRDWRQTYIFQSLGSDWKIIASIFHI